MTRPLRVFHLPTAIGNNGPELARMERALGIDSRAVCFRRHPFGMGGDEVLYEEGDGPLYKELKRFGLMTRLLRHADIVHCNFGRCLLPVLDTPPPPGRPGSLQRARYELTALLCRGMQGLDLALLRRAGKGIVVTYQGDDARQGDYSRTHFNPSIAAEVGPEYYSPRTDARKRRSIRCVDRYAHRVFALNPDLLHVLPARAEFLPYASVDPQTWPMCGVQLDARPLRVLHAPSHRGAKGTRHVIEAVRSLRAEGLSLELTLVEDIPFTEARRLYEDADILVDQVLAGFYGALAVELMALGKPVVAYIRSDDLGYLPPAMRAELPVISATPGELAHTLRTLVSTPRPELAALGRRGRAFVERWHDPRRIAADLIQTYREVMAEARSSGRR